MERRQDAASGISPPEAALSRPGRDPARRNPFRRKGADSIAAIVSIAPQILVVERPPGPRLNRRDRRARAARAVPAPRSRGSQSAAPPSASMQSAHPFLHNSHRCHLRFAATRRLSLQSTCAVDRALAVLWPDRSLTKRDRRDRRDSDSRLEGAAVFPAPLSGCPPSNRAASGGNTPAGAHS